MRTRGRSLQVLAVVLVATALAAREGCLSLRDMAQRSSCRPHWLVGGECREYAKMHEGMFPPLSSQFGRLMFDAVAVPPQGPVCDRVCESDPDVPAEIFGEAAKATPVNDWSYVYLGYFLENEAQGMAFVRAYHARAGNAGAFEQDLIVGTGAGNCGQNCVFRLREPDVLPPEASCLKALAASIPVIVEWPGHHRRGAHVVYLDGHTEYHAYPGAFPLTREFIEALRVIDAEIHLSPSS